MAKTACLVLASKAPAILAATLPVYQAAGWDAFVHVDAKFCLDAYRSISGDCNFINDRTTVFWGGYSMMEAELSLLRAALAGSYDQFVMMSDDTLPIVPSSELAALCLTRNRMTLNAVPMRSPWRKRYDGWFYYDHIATNPRWPAPPYDREIDKRLITTLEIMDDMRSRVGKKPLDLFSNFQFCALNRETAAEIIRIVDTDRWLVDSFRFSAIPDELMIATIIGNYMPQEVDPPMMWIDYASNGGQNFYRSADELPAPPSYAAFIRKVAHDAYDFARAHCEALLR